MKKKMGSFFGKGSFTAAMLTGAAALALGAPSARAAVTYSTSFESPAFVAGATVVGTDGWVAGSSSGASQTVSAARGSDGTQSLFFDNTGANTSFYSVEHPLGAFAGTILTLSVDLYVPSSNAASRLSEIEFSTGTLGSGVLGLSLDGAGELRAGKTWGALYGTAVLATAPAGTYADRWLTATLTLNTATAAGTVSISGFGGTTTTYSTNFTAITTPTNVNLGSDYVGTTPGLGSMYYDRFSISTAAVPEPSTVAATLAGTGLLGLAIRRRRLGC